MNYTELLTPHHVATFVDWIEAKGDLCVEIYVPHSGGGPSLYTVRSLADLKRIVRAVHSNEIQITIWKNHTQSELEADDNSEAFRSDVKWLYAHSDEVMYFSVVKNRNLTESYQKNPGKYAKAVEEWAS